MAEEHLSPEAKQRALVAQLAMVEDPQERMALLVGRGRKQAPLTEAERVEENRVKGCTSRVWVVATLEEGRCRFRLDADSTVVKGLAGCLCAIYDAGTPAEVVAFEPTLLEELRLAQHLSPTRSHGLQQVRRVMREFAEGVLTA